MIGILLAVVCSVAPGRGTLEKAIAETVAAGGGEVVLTNGVYELEAPIELGTNVSHLVLRAAEGTKPVVSAGRRIIGWQVGEDGVWRVKLPAGTKFSQFYVNGERRERPFLPRKGYWRIEDGTEQDKAPKFHPRIRYPEGSICADWPDLTNVEIRVFHNWSNTRMPIAKVDAAKREMTLAGWLVKACSDNTLAPRFWFRAENVRAAFGEEGDWYLTPDAELWYKPLPGEKVQTSETIASHHKVAMRIVGASDVRVIGITFSHANQDTTADGGRYCGQAGFFLPGMVHVTHARNVVFEKCAFTHTGAYGLVFAENCHACVVRDSECCDLGAGGFRIGNGSFDKIHPPDASTCVIEDCLIAHGGRVDPVAAGIWIGNASSNRVSHCTIHDMYYSGISCGWDWGLANKRSHHNILEYNHIYDIGQEVLSDLACIYTLAQQPGTIIRGNYVHDSTCSIYMGVGIYLDECSSCITVSNNIIRACQTGCFLQNSARSNLVTRNVIDATMNNAPPLATGGWTHPLAKLNHVEDNVMRWQGGELIRNPPSPKSVAFARNLCWSPASRRKKKLPAGFTWAQFDLASVQPLQAGKRTPNLLTADIRTRPAFDKGLGSKSGLKCNPYREDFETTEVGKWAKKLGPFPNATTGLEVTEEDAYTGKRCYKITDGMKPDWGPHVCTTVNRTGGVVRISFSLKCGKGSAPHFETRQEGGGQAPFGPNLSILPNGDLRTREAGVLTRLEHNVWYRFTVSFKLGEACKAPVYDITLRYPDGHEKTWKDLFYDEAFGHMTWIGFMSSGAPGTVYYLDDIDCPL